MARISTYTIDEKISGGDLLVGTAANSRGVTRNYTIESISDYISVAEQMKFKYVPQSYYGSGTFSIPSGASDNFPISNLSNIAISRKDLSPQDTVEFLTYLIGSDILIVKQDDVSNFGHFKIDSYTVNATEPAYFNMALTYIGGNGVLKLEEFYNIVNFVKATDVGDKTFNYDQITPSSTWNINHNLNKFPSVSVVDTSGTKVYTDVNYIDNNNVTLTFSASFAGKAYLN